MGPHSTEIGTNSGSWGLGFSHISGEGFRFNPKPFIYLCEIEPKLYQAFR